MDDSRRSVRARKTVDYAKFCGVSKDTESDDDDFKEKTAPPSKRKKEKDELPASPRVSLTKIKNHSQESNKGKKSVKESIKENEDYIPKPRKSLNDKVFERHLNTALEISKNDSETLSSNCDEESANSEHQSCSDKENSSSDDSIAEKENNKKEDNELSEDVDSAESESEEEGDSDWSNESDDGKKSKKGKKLSKKNLPKKEMKKSVSTNKLKSQLPAAEKYREPLVKSSITKCKSVPKINLLSKSPPQVNSSPLRLPATGLRLGLSRKIPGKPLHSVVKTRNEATVQR